VVVKRSGTFGYVIGISVWRRRWRRCFVFNPRRTKTTIVSVPASPGG
jgi:hypothetical protein